MSKFEGKFVIVDTPELLMEALDFYSYKGKSRFEYLGFDTETNGLQTYKSTIIGFSISPDENSGIYVPLLTWKRESKSGKLRKKKGEEIEIFDKGHLECTWTGESYPEKVSPNLYRAPKEIIDFLERCTKGAKLIMHNAVFDCAMVWQNFKVDLSSQLHCDTRLLKHYLDESTSTGLKETAAMWWKQLGFSSEEEAKAEQTDMKASVQKNGGKSGEVWRGDLELVGRYAIADTCLTLGLYRVGMEKLKKEYGDRGFELFYKEEIMPLCKEVVVPMRIGGVYIDVPHFEALKKELQSLINKYEDLAIQKIGAKNLEGFDIGTSGAEISTKAIVEKIIELEGLPYPTHTQKGEVKKSLSKAAVKKAYETEPHWLWGYILGFDELKYSPEKLQEIRNELYFQREGRRYQFNLNSDQHLRWLLFTKLGNDKASVPQTDSATKENPIPSCKAEVLEQYFKPKYEFIEYIQLFRKLGDMLSNYVEKAVSLHHNGWLSMDMDQAGTTSGRFACRGGFNLQTLPQIENLKSCPKCESKKVNVEKEGSLIAHLECTECGHLERNIICYSVIKQGFIAPPGMKIVTADYSSLEPTIFSEVSNDPKLKEIFIKNLDFYSKIYCDVEDAEGRYSADPKAPNFLKKVNPELRQSIKGVILAIPYGALGPQVANLLGFKKKILKGKEEVEVLDVDRGWAWTEKYLSAYPELRKYMEKAELDAAHKGYVETKMGRRRHYKYAPIIQKVLDYRKVNKVDFLKAKRKELEEPFVDLGDGLNKEDLEWICEKAGTYFSTVQEKDYWRYIRSLYKNDIDNAKNVQIQGLAGHVCNRAMLEVTRLFEKEKIPAYVALQVHDSIVTYVETPYAEKAKDLLKRAMEQNLFTQRLEVPIKADPVIIDSLVDDK